MVEAEEVLNVKGEPCRSVCNTALFTFVALDKEGKVQPIPQLTPLTEENQARYDAGKRRYEDKKEMRRKAREQGA